MKYIGLEKIVFVLVLLCSPVLQAEDAYEIEWTDQYGTTITNNYGVVSARVDHGKSVVTDSNGNIYVTGDVGGSLDGQIHNDGTVDMFISKYNATGIRQWSRLLGSSDSYYNNDYAQSIAIDSNDNIYVGGWTTGNLPGQISSEGNDFDGYLTKYNTDGQSIWIRQFGNTFVIPEYPGSTYYYNDKVEAVTTDINGNIYVTGRSYYGTQVNDEIFTKKFDAGGNVLWTEQLSSLNPSGWINDQVTSITTDSNGDVYVAGFTGDVLPDNVDLYTTYSDAFLAKYDAVGNRLWINQFGTTRQDQALSVTVGPNGNLTNGTAENIYVAGATYGCLIDIWTDCNDGSDAFVVAFNQNGTEVWKKQFGENGQDVAYSAATDDSGNVYLTGTTTGGWNWNTWGYYYQVFGYSDVYVVKFKSGGEFTWYMSYGARYVETPESISVDNSGNIYVAGTTNSILASPTSYVESPGYDDIFLTKLAGAAATNIAPVANAGLDSSVHIGELATLDGSASTDFEPNYPLTFAWSFSSVPSESGSLDLDFANTVNPSFIPDVPGDYVVNLVVTDSLGLSSLPDTVTVNTSNTPPFADAGSDQEYNPIVSLDGSESYDEDGDEFSFNWTITQQPEGSTASFDNPYAETPIFFADVNGDYEITLTVTDAWGAAGTDYVMVNFRNVAPEADAGANQSAVVGEVVMLNGGGSSDANGDPITFNWSLSTVPVGSAAVISDSSLVEPSFTADQSGTYIASLVVNDGIIDSAADSAEIVVVSFNTLTTQTVSETIVLINEIPVESFRNVNLSNALTNKLNAVLKMITNEQYGQAWNKLTTDILPKTDGCALYGVPDKKDWIKTCEEQEPVYNHILETIALLEMKL